MKLLYILISNYIAEHCLQTMLIKSHSDHHSVNAIFMDDKDNLKADKQQWRQNDSCRSKNITELVCMYVCARVHAGVCVY